jgi:hypothetical protein
MPPATGGSNGLDCAGYRLPLPAVEDGLRGGTEKNCRDWIAQGRNREPDKVDRGAYVIEGHQKGRWLITCLGLRRATGFGGRVSADEG